MKMLHQLPDPVSHPMIRISLSYIYKLASELEPLANLQMRDTPAADVLLPAIVAMGAVNELTSNTMYAPHLRASFEKSRMLIDALQNILNAGYGATISQSTMYALKSAFNDYKTVLLADLGIMHSYFVSQKGAFDTWSLLLYGENLFPAELAMKVPESIFDMREAGKCLAYENATAAGFHLFRVLEAVLRRYYTDQTGGKPQPKVRNIAVYVNAMMQAKKGDEKVLFLVREISDRFRNPLIHPDVVLTVDDAIAIHGLVRTAVTEMLKQLAVPAATTATAVISAEAAQ